MNNDLVYDKAKKLIEEIETAFKNMTQEDKNIFFKQPEIELEKQKIKKKEYPKK